MIQLPTELLLDIIDTSHLTRTTFTGYATLRSLSLVCRALEFTSQKALFRTVILTKRRQALSFLQAIDPETDRGKSLGRAVRSLTVKLEHPLHPEFKKQDITPKIFVPVLVRCPDVVEIYLRGINGCNDVAPFSYAEEMLLRQHPPRKLRSIRAHDSSTFGYSLWKLCPWVTSISLTGGAGLRRGTYADGFLASANLREIQWFGYLYALNEMLRGVEEDGDDDIEEEGEESSNEERKPYFDWSGVVALDIRQADSAEEISKVGRILGPNLRYLRLSFRSPMIHTQRFAEHIRGFFPKLEEFAVLDFPNDKVLDALPRNTIEHVSFSTPDARECTSYHLLRPMWEWVKTAKNLKTITLCVGVCPGHGAYQKLQEACDEVGAQLLLHVVAFGSYPGEQESLTLELVPCFPRSREWAPMRQGLSRLTYGLESFLAKMQGSKDVGKTSETESASKGALPTATIPIHRKKVNARKPHASSITGRTSSSKMKVGSVGEEGNEATAPSDVAPGSFVPEGASSFSFTGMADSLPTIPPSTSTQPTISTVGVSPAALAFMFGSVIGNTPLPSGSKAENGVPPTPAASTYTAVNAAPLSQSPAMAALSLSLSHGLPRTTQMATPSFSFNFTSNN